jgi:type I restriction enzyme R subunit
MAQAIEDGYLAACEILQRDIFFDDRPENERQSVLLQEDFEGKTVTDSRTGQTVPIDEQERYGATDFEKRLLLPDRVRAMCSDLFEGLVASAGGPEQKTIVFCARDQHADAVAAALNNLYAEWSAAAGRSRAEPYGFKCTATGGDTNFIPDLRGASRHHFIATTVDLLTTGVDVPVAWRAASAGRLDAEGPRRPVCPRRDRGAGEPAGLSDSGGRPGGRPRGPEGSREAGRNPP